MNDIQRAIETQKRIYDALDRSLINSDSTGFVCVSVDRIDDIKTAISAMQELQQYRELEEQGRLLKLPCAVGDTVYRINRGAQNPIIEMTVCGIRMLYNPGFEIRLDCIGKADLDESCYLSEHIGKKVFLTREAAEKALEGMKSE